MLSPSSLVTFGYLCNRYTQLYCGEVVTIETIPVLAALRLQCVCVCVYGSQFWVCEWNCWAYCVVYAKGKQCLCVHKSITAPPSLSSPLLLFLNTLTAVTTAASSPPPPPPHPSVGGSCYKSDSSRGAEIHLCTLRNYCFSTLRRKSDGTVVHKRGCSNNCKEEVRNRKVSS